MTRQLDEAQGIYIGMKHKQYTDEKEEGKAAEKK